MMISDELLQARRAELQQDLQRGREQVARLEAQLETLRQTMTRIQGAITLCDELLAGETATPIEDLLPPGTVVGRIERVPNGDGG